MSHDLVWLLLRKNNSYMVKTVREGPVFSKEPGNLTNLHSHKYSGLANAKTYSVEESSNGTQIVTRKTNVSQQSVKGARVKTGIRRGSGPRRAAGVSANKAKNGYRPDLAKNPLDVFGQTKAGRGQVCKINYSHLVARVHAIHSSQQEKKPLPQKKLRGKKAAAAAATEDMDVD